MTAHPWSAGPFTLAASSEMQFRRLPAVERVERIHALGFQAEIWNWTKHDAKALLRTGATFSSTTGYVMGAQADDDGADELLRTAAQSVTVAKELGIPRLNLHGTGLDDRGLPVKSCDVVTGAPHPGRAENIGYHPGLRDRCSSRDGLSFAPLLFKPSKVRSIEPKAATCFIGRQRGSGAGCGSLAPRFQLASGD